MKYYIVLLSEKLRPVKSVYVPLEEVNKYLEQLQYFTIELHKRPLYTIQITLVDVTEL